MYKKINRNLRFIAIFTLIITTAFVFVTCCTISNTRLRGEIKSSALLLADVLNSDSEADLSDLSDSLTDKRAALISPGGSVIFDSSPDSGRSAALSPEVAQARRSGFGDKPRFIPSRGESVYSCAVRLNDGSVLLIAAVTNSLWLLFFTIGIPVGIMALLIYLLSLSISARITENIIRPIEKSYSFGRENYDDVYVEIQPFLKRIAQQNKEIRSNIAELKRAEKMRREFSANVSHELKTPLTSIKGYSQLITSGIAKAGDIPEFAGKIEKEAGRLIILIDDIIKLSDLDENDTVLEKTDIDLLGIARDCADRLSGLAGQRGVTITVGGSGAVVQSNAHRIDELVYNLIDNAVKYNRDGGSVTVAVGTGSGGESYITVTDTGIGIPEKYLDRIFERFFRVDKSRSKKINGTGLGLSIVKHIAIISNADIDVKSEPGKGTSFTVTFR